jgi:uncharacterized protein (DUF58 family)
MIDGASSTVSATSVSAWRTTPSMDTALMLGLVLAALGILTSRVDVILLSVPLLLVAAVGADHRPSHAHASAGHIDLTRMDRAGEGAAFAYRVRIVAPAGVEHVLLRLTQHGAPVREVLLPHHADAVTGIVPVEHSGRQAVITASWRLVGAGGTWLSEPAPLLVAERVVAPRLAPIEGLPLPHRLTGLTGAHRSARPGDGGEFRDLHLFAAGDRLRRIDWKATARRAQGMGELYVRRTDATADATVMLVMDSRDDLGERVSAWSMAPGKADGISSLDLAREAAASIAVAAVSAGDRVGLIDLAALEGAVAPGGGKRHLDRVLRRIAECSSTGLRPTRRRAPVVPAGAIVYLFSTFFADDVPPIARWWRAAGHRVIAVDVLPLPDLTETNAYARAAHRLLMAERRQHLRLLRTSGVEMVRWQDGDAQPSRAVAFRSLAVAGQRRS